MYGVVMAAGLIFFSSCGDKNTPEDHSGHDMSSMTREETSEGAVEEQITQTTCPVMGGKIDKDIWVEHNGRKIYFCCAGCPEEFKKNPEKYIERLDKDTSGISTEVPFGTAQVKKAEIHYCNS